MLMLIIFSPVIYLFLVMTLDIMASGSKLSTFLSFLQGGLSQVTFGGYAKLFILDPIICGFEVLFL